MLLSEHAGPLVVSEVIMSGALRGAHVVVCLLAGATLACSASSRPDHEEGTETTGNGGSGTQAPAGGGSGGGLLSSGAGGGTGTGGPPGDVDWPESLHCPAKPQEILVFDFRSGWWDDLETSAEPFSILSALAQPCQNVTFEYHHVLAGTEILRCVVSQLDHACEPMWMEDQPPPPSLASMLLQSSRSDYTQLWVLSGTDHDGSVPESSALFADFLAQTAGSCLPVFIGAGDGNVTHANAVASVLGLGSPFVPFTAAGFVVLGEIAKATHAAPSVPDTLLYQGVDVLADQVTDMRGFLLRGDTLAESPHYGISVLDDSGSPAVAVGAIMLPDSGPRPFVLDAGVQRFYAIRNHPGTLTYAANIIKLLGSVGCAADPIE